MRHLTIARRVGVPAAAVVLGALVASPAFADVSVSPTTAEQGSGQNLTFKVTNTGTAPLGTVKLQLPADTAIAEVYPLSHDDWAPRIDHRKLATPLATIHGSETDQATAAITWLAMPGRQLAPGASADLRIAIGPLPTLSSVRFEFATTYADGKPGPAMPVSVSLTPPAPGAPKAASHHGGGTGGTGGTTTTVDQLTPDEQAALAQAMADGDGLSFWSIGGWVVAGLALAGGAVFMFRGRHRATEDDDEPQDEEVTPAEEPAGEQKEPVGAGSSKWAYKG